MKLFSKFSRILGGRDQELLRLQQIADRDLSFEEEVSVFKGLGIEIRTDIDMSDVKALGLNYRSYSDQPFFSTYVLLGSTIQRIPFTPVTDRLYLLDLEAIDDVGSYVSIMNNISRITQGDIVFQSLKDFVDIDEEGAWVSFLCQGTSYKWDLKVDNDWADPTLFDNVQQLAEKLKTGKKFTFFATGGQDFVLGYCSDEELANIRSRTALNVEWLDSRSKGQFY